jgi:hypothetical protein
MLCSTFTTITRHDTPNTSEFEDGWRTNNLLGRSQNGSSDCLSNIPYTVARSYEIREYQQPKSQARSIAIAFQAINIHTGWYVSGGSQKRET